MPFLIGEMLVNLGDILPETSESSACLDMGVNSHLTWLSSDSLFIPSCKELELEFNITLCIGRLKHNCKT